MKHERFQRLLDTLYPIFYENNIPYKDKVVDVLVEEVSKNDEMYCQEELEQAN